MAEQLNNSSDVTRSLSVRRFFLLGLTLLAMAFQNLRGAGSYLKKDYWNSNFREEALTYPEMLSNNNHDSEKTATIAYAVSITACSKPREKNMFDGAAVVHQSARLAHLQSKYDYHMIAFMHPEAVENCKSQFENLGYEVQIRDTPFNETEIPNETLRIAQGNGCCGAREYLKLYSYVQFDYPVVVHLDLDCLVLKPMDDVFDLMIDPSFDRSRISTQWLGHEEFPSQVDFLFTRDYNMVSPPRKKPRQMGVQGGFLIVRPNQTDFDRLVEIIMTGGGEYGGGGWGKSRYGGYYGAGTIQGLASYYYGEFASSQAVELNRCYYNTMVDDPYNSKEVQDKHSKELMCRTLEPNLTCQDCRKTDLEDIYTAHFTVCGKPNWCVNPTRWWQSGMKDHYRLCMELFREWHTVRLSLETEWMRKFADYKPNIFPVSDTNTSYSYYLNFSLGHCRDRGGYVPLVLPSVINTSTSLLPYLL